LDESTVMSSMAATNPRWLAPEILGGNNATFASDVYSFGVVMWELMTWDLPWGVTNPWQVVTVVMEGGRLSIPTRDNLPGPDTDSFEGLDDYIGLMKRCWAHIQEDRPCFQEIISELRKILADTLARTGKVQAPSPKQSSDDLGKSEKQASQSSMAVTQSLDSQVEEGESAYYASTGAQTGSVVDINALNASWGTKLKSHQIPKT
jgi:serine/threonine protein kinase